MNTYELTLGDNHKFIMQDCPGHQDFSEQILLAAVEPDAGVLVVDAT